MAISWGVSPIAWINDDLPALGADTPVEQVLREAQAIGFEGIELGGRFPRDPDVLSSLLSRHALRLIGGWYGSSLLARSAEAEIAALGPHLDLLRRLGSHVFILAETSNTRHTDPGARLDSPPRLAPEDWATFGRRLDQVADYLADRGMMLAYHHHLGTVVETEADLHRLLDATGDRVGLTLDTGHAALGGIDPVAVIRRHPRRIVHVHCKDIRRDRYRDVRASGGSFLDGVRRGMFTVPGDGDQAFAPVLDALAAIDYAGWCVVEAEQDPDLAPPAHYQRLGLATLQRLSRP